MKNKNNDSIWHTICLIEKSFRGLEIFNEYTQTSNLETVFRWGLIRLSWWRTILNPRRRLRLQNDLVHSFSLSHLASDVTFLLKRYNPQLDSLWVVNAASKHELGEGELKSDVCALIKKHERDCQEYLAFAKILDCFQDPGLKEYNIQIFLLQFAAVSDDQEEEAWKAFPEIDKERLRWLKTFKWQEALVFHYLEKLEYILFGLEQGRKFKNYVIVENVLKNQSKEMEAACGLIPGWEQKIWTPNISFLAKETLALIQTQISEKKLFNPNK